MKNFMKTFHTEALIRRARFCLLALTFAHFITTASAQTEGISKTNRWEGDIRAFEASDRTNSPPTNAVLFAGASNIRLWKNVAQAFPAHKVLNRGFGGAEMSDLAEFAGRIVIPYHPKILIIYAGDNDLADRKTPEQILADFKALTQKVHAALPDTIIGCIAIKPSPSRARLLAQVKATDGLLESFCRSNKNLVYIDDFTPLLSKSGAPRPELFIKDGLHLNEQGRAIWISLIGPVLDRYDPPTSKTPL
jgi:lysophospholipase L1-like esterase